MSNIFFGKTNYDCVSSLIKKLKENFANYQGAKHFFIVPDRISVLTEIKIFECLGIKSTCNIQVMTLSRLASMILSDMNVISKTASCMIVQKILKNKKNELKCFNKKIDGDLGETIFSTISQFKSCKIGIDEIEVKTKNQILSDKLFDISLVYNEYQKYLKDNNLFDGLDRLNFVTSQISKSNDIKNAFFYVGYFDSFTYQGFQILNEIISVAKEFNIGLCFSDSLINGHIYENGLKEKILELFNLKKIIPQINFCKESSQKQFKVIQDNLFGFNQIPVVVETSDINLFEAKDFEEEVIFVASKIKDMIVNQNYKFGDFVVAVPNLNQRKNMIEKIFTFCGFNFFLDFSEEFKNNLIVRFIKDLKDVYVERFSRVSILSLIKNPIFQIDYNIVEDFEDYLFKYNIDDEFMLRNSNVESCKYYENFNKVRTLIFENLNEFLISVKNSKTFGDFISCFENVLLSFNVQEKFSVLAREYAEKGDVKQTKIFEQSFNIMQKLFDELKILSNEDCDLNLFFSTLFCGISAIKISTSPMLLNSIFVGEVGVSFFDKSKVCFILDASEENFPQTISDCGIISDKEIDELSECYKIEPSIKNLNFKERFKAFEILLSPKDKLFLSYNYEKNSTQKSKILTDISKMFCLVSDKKSFAPLSFYQIEDIDFLTLNNNEKIAKNNLINSLRNVYDGKTENKQEINELFSSLKDNVNIDFSLFNFVNKINLKNDLYFKDNVISVSKIEDFMKCPFVFFARNGLKIKEKDFGELDNLNIGNILHEVARTFGLNKLPVDDLKVEFLAKNAFQKALDKDKFDSIKLNDSNRVLIENLLKESIRFCQVLNYQAKYSSFKILKTEVRFDDEKQIKSLKIRVNNRILKLVGQVDRIDVFENYFRIIDYKTGKCDTNLKELFFGKKIQLEAYIKVCEESLKLKPAGAYYFPVKSGFADDEKDIFGKYQLKGRTINDEKIIFASDSSLKDNLKSNIIEVKLLKSQEMSKRSNVLSFKQMQNLADYSISLIERACSDILKLDITPSPLILASGDDICKNCSYYGLCRFDENCLNVKRTPKIDINLDFFKKGEE